MLQVIHMVNYIWMTGKHLNTNLMSQNEQILNSLLRKALCPQYLNQEMTINSQVLRQ